VTAYGREAIGNRQVPVVTKPFHLAYLQELLGGLVAKLCAPRAAHARDGVAPTSASSRGFAPPMRAASARRALARPAIDTGSIPGPAAAGPVMTPFGYALEIAQQLHRQSFFGQGARAGRGWLAVRKEPPAGRETWPAARPVSARDARLVPFRGWAAKRESRAAPSRHKHWRDRCAHGAPGCPVWNRGSRSDRVRSIVDPDAAGRRRIS
jgi:hypothetical protein